jgi:hypothetical protein
MTNASPDPWAAIVSSLSSYRGDYGVDHRMSLRDSHAMVALLHQQRDRIQALTEEVDRLQARLRIYSVGV